MNALEEEKWQLTEDVKALEEDLDVMELVIERAKINRTLLKSELRLAKAKILDQVFVIYFSFVFTY